MEAFACNLICMDKQTNKNSGGDETKVWRGVFVVKNFKEILEECRNARRHKLENIV
jgi:hypothetical protein